jgi:hypothetical protein
MNPLMAQSSRLMPRKLIASTVMRMNKSH